MHSTRNHNKETLFCITQIELTQRQRFLFDELFAHLSSCETRVIACEILQHAKADTQRDGLLWRWQKKKAWHS